MHLFPAPVAAFLMPGHGKFTAGDCKKTANVTIPKSGRSLIGTIVETRGRARGKKDALHCHWMAEVPSHILAAAINDSVHRPSIVALKLPARGYKASLVANGGIVWVRRKSANTDDSSSKLINLTAGSQARRLDEHDLVLLCLRVCSSPVSTMLSDLVDALDGMVTMKSARLCITTFLLGFLQSAYAFRHVPGSPCSDICSGNPQSTLENDVVCLDDSYFNTADGQALYNCVACELNSTAVDTARNQSDVEFALLDLRYTVSECLFAFPEQRISISNPCVVTCQPLAKAIGYQLGNDSSALNPSLSFCNAAEFDDTTINNCAFCYGLIPQQRFLANMLQALHVACRQPPTQGSPFFPDAQTIFNATLIAGPSPLSTTSSSSGGLHGWKLAIAIALPIVGGILVLCAACFCCFVYTRRRRNRMAQEGRMSRLHDSWGEAAQYMDGPVYEPEMSAAQEQEMKPLSPQWRDEHHPRNSPVLRISPGLPTEVVGPGEGQIQDHNLHERYLGTPTNLAEDEIGVARSGSGMEHHSPDVYQTPEAYHGKTFHEQVIAGPSGTNEHYHEGRQQDERGQWV